MDYLESEITGLFPLVIKNPFQVNQSKDVTMKLKT